MELLPCPFCSSTEVHSFHHVKECVKCMGCNSIFMSDNAKEKWNTRPSQWISVKDRLPEKEEDYIVFGKASLNTTSTFMAFAVYILSSKQFTITAEVTHWMHLPTPPTNL